MEAMKRVRPVSRFIYYNDLSYSNKYITERSKESPLRRPIGDGKYDVGERTLEIVLQRLPKVDSRAAWIIGEGTTAPCAEHNRRVTVAPRNGEDAVNTALQEVSGLRLANCRRVWRRTCQETQ